MSEGLLRQLPAVIVDDQGSVVCPVGSLQALVVLEEVHKASGYCGPYGRSLPHDPATVHVDGDVHFFCPRSGYADGLLYLEPCELRGIDLYGGLVDGNLAGTFFDHCPGDSRLPLSACVDSVHWITLCWTPDIWIRHQGSCICR
ncbi:hypothetical protein SDC9_207352 [bioreactor metagenome]|uniref:Uncharacterized protein n=1 Tax=bioreactor metagenome TaxID=1076179 RepID=A0A645J7N8_9ZZZZ